MRDAPLFSELAEGPDAGQAWYLDTSDNVQIRVGLWGRDASKGTVLLFPGRTEYIEKYGRTATELYNRGLATLTIDWRGQGLADRLISDKMAGHVQKFGDYQNDVAAMVAVAEELNLPKPWYLLAHSMGGAIGFRALQNGLPVKACCLSAPMLGILMADAMQPVAWALSWIGIRLGKGHTYTPGTKPASYVTFEPFEKNKLTTDLEMYEFMQSHVKAQPELGLGGPSLRWLNEALKECKAMAAMPSPDLPCLTILGSDEEIVCPSMIHSRMANWPQGELLEVPGKRHEILMENPGTRTEIIGKIIDFFEDSTGSTDHVQPAAAAAQGG